MKYIDKKNVISALNNFKNAIPFDHCVIDNFFLPGVAEDLEKEFPSFDSKDWYTYKNKIEDKKALNDWNKFPTLTSRVFQELMSPEFVTLLQETVGCNIYIDPGLHGGGWHMHGPGGNLNPHLDYSIHPKLRLLRKINIIMYLSSSLKEENGGHLGLWDSNPEKCEPNNLIAEVFPKFNSAVAFDTTQNSWHGMSRTLTECDGVYRKSLAIYYLTDPKSSDDARERALFAPREEQKDNEEIKKLIETRADSKKFHTVYQDK